MEKAENRRNSELENRRYIMYKRKGVFWVSLMLCGMLAACGDDRGNYGEEPIAESRGEASQEETDAEMTQEQTKDVPEQNGENNALSPERLITDQTFEVELNPMGNVTFASYAPDAAGNAKADVIFAVLRGDEVLQVLEGMETDNVRTDREFDAVEAVSFPDYNGDGVNDVIAISSYFMEDGADADTDAEGKVSEIRIYRGNEDGSFTLEKELSQETDSALAEKTVQSVLGFLGADTSAERLADAGWQQSYITYIKSQEAYEVEGYVLIYLDEDDIPELVRVCAYGADGCRIVSWYEGNIYENQLSRFYFSYIEKENLLCNSEGSMDSYYDIVYRLEEGKLVTVAGGYYGTWGNSNVQFDEQGEPVYQYEWNGSSMSREEYQQKLQEVYDSTKAKDGYSWEEIYSAEEMMRILEEM